MTQFRVNEAPILSLCVSAGGSAGGLAEVCWIVFDALDDADCRVAKLLGGRYDLFYESFLVTLFLNVVTTRT